MIRPPRPVRALAVLRRAVVSAMLATIVVLPAGAQEIVFGADVSFQAGLEGTLTPGFEASPIVRSGFDPELAVFSDSREFRVAARSSFDYPAGIPVLALDTLHLRLFPADTVTVDLGLLKHLPGGSPVLSPVNYLSPITFDLGAGGGVPSVADAAFTAGVSVFVGSGYLSAAVAPAPQEFGWPTLGAGSLEQISILTSTADADVGTELFRSSVTLGDTLPIANPWARVSGAAEAGFAAGPVDLTAVYYHGIDRIPTISLRADAASAPPGRYDLQIRAVESVIDAIGISAQTAAGPASIWFDGSFVFGRQFGSTNLEPTATPDVYVSENVTAPHLELVAGGLVWLDGLGLSLVGEYRHGFIFSDRDDLIRLDFPGTALVSVTGDVAGGLVSLSGSAVTFIPDRSAVLLGSATVSPSSELSVYIQVPFVMAAQESLFGGLQSRFAATAGLVYRF